MNWWKLMLILTLLTAGAIQSGCSLLPGKEVYVPVGHVAEIAGAVKIPVYVTNSATGKKEKRVVRVRPDGVWHVGRLAPKDGEVPEEEPKKSLMNRLKSFFSKG
jgi:hypothetical protein